MNNKAFCAGLLLFAFSLTSLAANVEIKIDSGEVSLSSCSEFSSLGVNDTLVKTGDGKLVITTELYNMKYLGDIIVSNGILRLNADHATGYFVSKDDKTQGSLTIVDGAALDVGPDSPSANGIKVNSKNINIAGTGVNNSGAIFTSGSKQQSYIPYSGCSLNLIGDALIKCISSKLGPSGDGLNLNGHKLTIDTGVFEVRSTPINGPGEIIVNGNCQLYLENTASTVMSAPTDAKITVKDGGQILCGGNKLDIKSYPFSKYSKWPIYAEGSASWLTGSWGVDAYLAWNGPINLGSGTLTFKDSNGNVCSNMIFGAVTGETIDCNLCMNGTRTLVMTNKQNSIAGKITVSNGTLVYAGAVGDSGVEVTKGNFYMNESLDSNLKVTGSSSVAKIAGSVTGNLIVSDGGVVTADSIGENISGGTGSSLTIDLSEETGSVDSKLLKYWRAYTQNCDNEWSTDNPFNLSILLPTPYIYEGLLTKGKCNTGLIVSHTGDGTMTIASEEFSDTPAFKNISGEMILSPATADGRAEVGWIDVQNGTLTIPAGKTIVMSTNSATVAAQYPNLAKIAIKGQLISGDDRYGLDLSQNAVSRPSGVCRGICEVFDGAMVTNIYKASAVGYVRSQQKAPNANTLVSYYQHGGFVGLWGDDDIKKRTGGTSTTTHYYPGVDNNYYYSLEGGIYTHGTCADVRMSSSSDKYGIFAMSGGTNTMEKNCGTILGNGNGRVIYYQTGGLTKAESAQWRTCKENWEKNYDFGGCRVSMTFDGPDAEVLIGLYEGADSISLCNQVSSYTEVNIFNSASFGCNCIAKATRGTIRSTGATGDFTNNHAVVNFDGGILNLFRHRAATVESNVAFSNFVSGVDHIYVHSGGAIIDTNPSKARDRHLGAALEAPPSSNGVKSIPLTDEVAALAAWEFTGAPWVEITAPSGSNATAVAVFDSKTGKVTGIRVMNPGAGYPESGVVATLSKGGSPNTYTLPCTVGANVSGGFAKKGEGTLIVDYPCTYSGKTILAGGTLKFECDHAVNSLSRFVLAGGTLNMNGKSLSDGSTSVTDWGLDVTWALANGGGTYATLDALPAGSTLKVSGADKLPTPEEEPNLYRVNLLTVTGGLDALPTPTLEETPTAGWSFVRRGNTYCFSRARPLTVLIK